MSKQPLHKALFSGDLSALLVVADKHSLDHQTLTQTMYLLSDYNQRGIHITPLQAAVITGNYRVCKRLLIEGTEMFSLSYNFPHPLNMALDCGKFQIAKLLITYGAKVSVSQHGFYPMYFAIKQDTPEYIIEAIINAGFPPDHVVEESRRLTALHRAIACNNISVVKVLMKNKANCNEVELHEGFTPIHFAVKLCLPQIVQLLAEHGANLELECKEGYTPLFHAIIVNSVKMLELLLQFGARIDHLSSSKLVYPLNLAANLCRMEITQVLLKHKADVKAVASGTGNMALHSAAVSQRGKICKRSKKELKKIVCSLIESGSEVDRLNKYGYSPMQLAIKEENFEIVELLVREGASVNCKLDQGTNFHLVARLASREVVTVFLQYGADCSVVNENGVTPYHMAFFFNSDPTLFKLFWKFFCPYDLPTFEGSRVGLPLYTSKKVAELNNQELFFSGIKANDVAVMHEALAKGAEVRGCSLEMRFPLHWAVLNGFDAVVHLMLDQGLPATIVNNEGDTALHLAACTGQLHVCVYLLRYGACYNVRSRLTGLTPLDLALRNRHQGIVSLLSNIDELFQSCDETYVIAGLSDVMDNYMCNLYAVLALINCINTKGETLMAVALTRGFDKLASKIMTFRLQTKMAFELCL